MNAPRKTYSGVSASKINEIIDYIVSLTPRESATISRQWTSLGVVYDVKASRQITGGIDLSLFRFGATVSGAVVTIKAGSVVHGTRTAVNIADTDLTFSAAGKVWVEYDGVSTASLEQGTSFPDSTSTLIVTRLYSVAFSSGVASISSIHHVGDIQIPAVYA